MYEEYFGLKRPPFKITPDTSLFFGGGKRRDILGALVYAVQRGEGIVKVVGEVGSGKTMLCRMLQQELPKSVEIIYIANPSVSAEDILFVMAHELELPVSKGASKHEVMHMMQDYLVQRHMENKQVVLFIEEAQGMPLETLEEIRLLSNLETDQNKLLQIILFGQPELDDNLALKSIRQLRERITHSFELLPLSSDEIHQYLNFRMREVGYTGPELITLQLAKKIQRYSGGLLRRINIIADKILLSAFAESTHNLNSKHLIAAVKDSGFTSVKSDKNKTWPVVSLIISILLVVTLYQFQNQWLEVLIGKSVVQTITKKHTMETVVPKTEQAKQEIKPAIIIKEIDDQQEIVGSTTAKIAEPANKEINAEIVQSDTIASETLNYKDTKTLPDIVLTKANITAATSSSYLSEDDNQWLNAHMEMSKIWLAGAKKTHVSIQLMRHDQTAAEKMVRLLQKQWPLDLKATYVFRVQSGSRYIYRVFYREFNSVPEGMQEIKQLPQSVKVNGPYLHSIYKMQDDLLN
ncbi:MAG: MSHA biogenesis protein MshM [Candidatus Azotimanducaceae bacterium]|jgi:MSHA biogenesis protein MshM